MKNTNKTDFRGKAFIFVILAIALCLTLTVGATLFGVRTSTDGGIAHAESAAPFRTYTSLNPSTEEGFEVYRGITTAAGLKKNLTVTGTTADGEYTLTADEYVIKRGETTLAATDYIADADGDDTAVTLQIASGSAVETIIVNVAADAPASVAALTVTAPASVPDDHTASTIHKVITVKDGETTLRSDLYSTELLGEGGSAIDALTAGQRAQVRVTTFDGKTETVSLNVTAATLIGADLRVADGISLDGLYYKRNGKDVFVRGSTNREVFDNNLVITAIYENSRKTVTPAYNQYDAISGATDNSYGLSVNNQGIIGDDEANRTVAVTLSRSGGSGYTASLNINFAEVAIVEIGVNADALAAVLASDKYSGKNRNSYTTLQLADFMSGDVPAIEFVRNNGTTTTTIPTGATATFVGNLAPTAKDVLAYESASDKDNFTYSRDVKVQFNAANGSVFTSAPITVSDIYYATPSGMSNTISGSFATQTMHHEFDYSGLTVTVQYNRGRVSVDFNLSDFFDADSPENTAKFLTTYLYDSEADDAVPVEGTVVTKDTKVVNVKFTYGSFSTNEKWGTLGFDLDIVKDPVTAPELDTSPIVYTNGCYKAFKDVSQLQYGAAEFGHDNVMDVSLYSDAALTSPVSAEYAEYANGKISFYSGGTYYVKVALGANADEYTLTTSSNITISPDGSYAVYPIVVTKGMLAIGIDNVTDKIYYGDYPNALESKIKVNGAIGGVRYELVASGAGDGQLEVPYKLVYIKADADDYDPANYDYDSYTAPTVLDAGRYHVYAITRETNAYLASKSRVGGYITVEILKKELTFSDVATQTYTRGKSFKVSDFIKSSGNFAYSDTADQVLAVTYTGTDASVGVADGKPTFTHKGEYPVTLGINAAYAKNYALAEAQPANVEFVINGRTLSLSASANGWTYGDTAPDPDARAVKGTPFYAAVKPVAYFVADASGEPTGTAIDIAVEPFDKWAVGSYVAVFETEYDAAYPDEATYEDYDLPTAKKLFAVTAKKIKKITISDSGWSETKTGGNWIGAYGTTINATLDNYDADNTAPSASDKIVTVTVAGTRLAPNATEAISDLETAFDYATGKLALTQAGNYTVTIELNSNYTWTDDTKDDIVYYGDIYKRYLTGLALSADAVYSGEKQTASVTVSDNGGGAGWTTDAFDGSKKVLTLKSVVGTSLAADGVVADAADISQADGTFGVTYAGEYTVTVALNDKNNYEFNDGDTSSAAARVADRTLTYTVEQAAFKAIWDDSYGDGDTVKYEFDESKENQRIPAGKPNVAFAADNAALTVAAAQVYTDADCANAVAGNAVKASGTYYIRVTAIGGDAKDNYYLPTDAAELGYITVAFVIESGALVVPELTNGATAVEVEFKGDAYNFSDYIKDFAANYVNGDITRVVIKVDDTATESMRDVKLVGDAVSAYDVTVAPAENYAWDTEKSAVPDDDAQYVFAFTFKITQLKVDLTWTKDGTSGGFVYGDGVAHTPAVTFDNNKDGVDATLTLSYNKKNDSAIIADTSGTADAGEYEATVALGGDKLSNYTLDGVTVKKAFTVKKKALGTPATNGASLTFDGTVQTVAYGWTDYDGKATGAVVGVNDNTGVPDAFKSLADCAFDSARGELSFLHAGKYTVTFTLTADASKNYCWTNGGAEKFDADVETVTTDELAVARQTLLAPALGDQRAIELVTGTSLVLPDNINDGDAVDGVKFAVAYGIYDTATSAWNVQTLTSTSRGTVYFVKLTVDGTKNSLGVGTFSPYDYLWTENSAGDTEGMSFVSTLGGVYGAVSDDGIDMYLSFVITKQQVGALFAFEGYTFGDNGYQSGATRAFSDAGLTFDKLFADDDKADAGNTLKLTYLPDTAQYPDSAQDMLGWIADAKAEVSVEFYDATGKTLVTDLVNGLPWNNGEYIARVNVKFKEADAYNDFANDAAFVVDKLLAEVEWSATDSATYNGEGQTRDASVTNLPQKESGTPIAAPALTVSKVTNAVWTGDSPAAQYVEITGISDDNYTIDGLANKRNTFTIVPKPIAVTGTDVAAHVYGDAIKDSEKAYAVNAGYAFEDDGEYIIVEILDGDGKAVTATTDAGEYRVVPRLIDAHGNYVLADGVGGASLVTEGKLTVVARRLSVRFGNVSSVYGQALADLYGAAQVSSVNGVDGFGIVSGHSLSDIVALSAIDGAGSAITMYSHISDASHSYKISCVLGVGVVNYALDTFGEYAYVIAPADITVARATGYASVYDAQEHNAFDIAATAVNAPDAPDGNALKFFYSADGSAWTEYSVTDGVASARVRNVGDALNGEYYIKITADNHSDYVTASKVKVEVRKATLTVSVNIGIYYGENSPLDYDGGGNVFEATVAALRTEGGIYSIDAADFKGGDKALFYGDADFYGLDKNATSTMSYAFGDKAYVKGDGIDAYTLVFVKGDLACENYEFAAATGALTVSALPVSIVVNNGDSLSAVYNSENPSVPEITAITTEATSIYDDNVVEIYGIADFGNIATVVNPALDIHADGVTTNRAGTYDVTVTLRANYALAEGGYVKVTYTIERASNQITTENYELFVNAVSQKASAPATAAWTYGDYDAAHVTGYNPQGDHALNPVALLSRDGVLTVKLTRMNDHAWDKRITVAPDGDATAALERLFAETHKASGFDSFYAGAYSVEFNMPETDNYNAFSERWIFKVGKQDLEITPVSSTVVYGEDISTRELVAGITPTDDADGDYPYIVSGLVKNNGVPDTLGSVVTFTISSSYAAGYENGSVGAYDIRATQIAGVDSFAYDGDTYAYNAHNNYAVKFRTGTLTVTARTLSVAIDDLTNYYNFIHYVTAEDGKNGHYDTNERFDGYSFAVKSGSFADGDGDASDNAVFTLNSVAVKSDTETAAVGEYPVYLLPKDGGHYYSKLDGATPNYAITVKDGYSGSVAVPDGAISQNAGTHKIVKAVINVTIDDTPYTDIDCTKPFGGAQLIYDGTVKYFKAEYSLPGNMNQTAPGTLTYYVGTRNSHTLLGNGSADYAPENAGQYYVEYKLDDETNYSAPAAYKEYLIGKKTIAVAPRSVSNAEGAYVSIGGVYYFNGGQFDYGVDFTGLIAGEESYLTHTLERTLYAGSNVAESDKDAFMTFVPNVESAGFSFKVRNAGTYAAAITLADRGDFLANNYMFANGTDTFTLAPFVIAPDTLYVDTRATSVEYGYKLDSVTSDKLGVTYKSLNYESRTAALIEAEQGMRVNGKPFLALPSAFDADMFDSGDYGPKTSKWGNTYDLTLKASEITAYNFTIVPRGTDVLSIDAHKLTLEVSGYDDGVTLASCVYAGSDVIDGQAEGHNPHVADVFGNNRNKFLLIKSDNGGFTAPSDYKDPFGSVSLRISNGARTVGKYPLAPSQDKSAYPMYDITFVNASGEVIESNLEDSGNAAKLPKWYISPATLKIAVGQYAANVSYANLVKSFAVPYGTDITYDSAASNSTFAIRYSGWVNASEGNDFGALNATHSNHTITRCNVEGDGGVYAPWTSIAGGTFTATPVIGDLTYTNYTIVIEEATVRISPLAVSATASRVEYREARNPDGSKKYNGGRSGDEHAVTLAFKSATDGIVLPERDFAPFAYDVAYRTTAGAATSAGVNANSAYGAPIVVGEYKAAVTFGKNANGEYNYTFIDGENAAKTLRTFDHEVYKQTIVLSWMDDVMTSGVAQVNAVNSYVLDIMDVVSFAVEDAQVSEDAYTVDANGFKVNVPENAVGTYRLTVRFNADAAKNYCWDTADADKIISFKVSLASNIVDILNLAIADWTFDTPESEPTAELSHPSLGGRILFSYALAGNIDIDAILGGGSRDVPSSVGNTLLYNATPRYAGWYVLCASYSYGEYSAANKYYLFKIDKATVGAPVLGIVTEGEGKNDMYNGNRLTADVTHSAQAYVDEFVGDRSILANGTRLSVLNANESGYTVRFALKDYANYMWDEAAIGGDDAIEIVRNDKNEITAVILRWVVNKADKHDVIWNASAIWNDAASRYELTYGDSYSISARSTYSSSVKYAYAPDTGVDYDDIGEWSGVLPTSAGDYVVRVVCDGNDNYVPALGYRAVHIGKATLTATPYGSIVYGDAFSYDACDFRLSGYRNSARPEIVRDDSLIAYVLADGALDTANLDAGDYKLIMRVDANGYVLGVTLDNYNVTLAADGGVFTVERKRVSVSVGNASGVYLENIDLDGVSLEITSGLSASLTTAQIKQMLGVKLSTTADSDSTVGRYAITATATNGNYAVEFANGEYTVTELRVRVEISAGGGEYDGVIKDAVVTHIYTVNASEEKDLIGDDILEFSYRYSGVSYSGVSVNGTTRPTLAGMYIATVTGITNNANYILDLSAGDVSVPFVITRKVINAGKLVIESAPYTGGAIEPIVKDEFYNIDGEVIYTVVPHDDFVKGGTYEFKLRLADPDNYRWMSVEDGVAERSVSFTITKAQNALTSTETGKEPTIEIAGWTFGQFDAEKNKPHATVKFGSDLIVYTYASHRDGPYTTAVPSDGKAGEYWVRVTVRETDNYGEFVSEPVRFVIDKLRLTAPALQTVTEGEGKNDTYTGGELGSLVLGFDSVLMGVYYDGSVNINGSRVTVFAVNAGEYEVKISLKDPVNYAWAEGTRCDGDGNALLGWTVARKKIAKPVDGKQTLIVNGKILEYIPDGFDGSIMRISGNKSGYGGTFTATVELIDTDNYVWADDTVAPVEYVYEIVGSHTVFIAVIGSLGGVAGALAAVAAVQFVLVRKKKRAVRGEEASE